MTKLEQYAQYKTSIATIETLLEPINQAYMDVLAEKTEVIDQQTKKFTQIYLEQFFDTVKEHDLCAVVKTDDLLCHVEGLESHINNRIRQIEDTPKVRAMDTKINALKDIRVFLMGSVRALKELVQSYEQENK